MNAAGLSSPRLRRVWKLLSDRKEYTTRDIVRKARVMAVSSCVAELRVHGAKIGCHRRIVNGQRRFCYRMTKEPDAK